MMGNKHYRQSLCKSTYRKGEDVALPKKIAKHDSVMRWFSISIFVTIVKNRSIVAPAYMGQIDYIEISNLYNRSAILCIVQKKANPEVAQTHKTTSNKQNQ